MPKRKLFKTADEILRSLCGDIPSHSEDSAEDADEESDVNNSLYQPSTLNNELPLPPTDVIVGHSNHDSDIGTALSMLQDSDCDSDNSYVPSSEDSSGSEDEVEDSADENDSDSDENAWKKLELSKTIPLFTSGVKPTNNFTPRSLPIEYFSALFPDEIISKIAEQSNLYAKQNGIKFWSDINNDDLKTFFGILILMGIIPLPTADLYWSSDPIFHNSTIANSMTVKQFKKILEGLHLNDNSQMPKKGEENYDRIFKIRPLHDGLNNTFENAAFASSHMSVDEIMVKFKGRSTLKQYIPNKPIKRGYKLWARCDSETGYLYQFQLYHGKDSLGTTEVGLGYKVVTSLCEKVAPNTLVCFDNYFTSVKLMEDLYKKGIFSVGTLRPDRKHLPVLMKKKIKLQRGDYKWRSSENTVAIRWQDTKIVNLLSTAHNSVTVQSVTRKEKDGSCTEVSCPQIVVDYIKSMGGVDRQDQLRSSYKIGRRSRRWWLRLFYFLLDSAIVNAYILYTLVNGKGSKTHLDFRVRLARALISTGCSRTKKDTVLYKRRGTEYCVPDEIRLSHVGIHMPKCLNSYKRCRVCNTKTNDKRTKIECSHCKVALCATPCFEKFHRS